MAPLRPRCTPPLRHPAQPNVAMAVAMLAAKGRGARGDGGVRVGARAKRPRGFHRTTMAPRHRCALCPSPATAPPSRSLSTCSANRSGAALQVETWVLHDRRRASVRPELAPDGQHRGGGRSAARLPTIRRELGTNGGAPPVVEHPRLDLQRAPLERLAEHVEREWLGGAVAGKGRGAHRCRGAVVVRRKIRGRLARAPTRTPPSPRAPRPSAASIAAAIATLGGAGWRSGGVQRGRSGAVA